MEILRIDFAKLRNNEHLNCMNEVKQLIAEHTATALGIVNQTEVFLQTLLQEEEAINPQLKSEKTDLLVDDDAKRDDTFRGMASAVFSACSHFNPEVRAAANKLQTEIFKPFGNITRLGYNEETTAIDSLCADLQTTYATECNALGLNGWIEALINDNDNFKKTSSQRVEEASVKSQLKMKQVRGLVDEAYKAIPKRIEALIEINGITAYQGFVNKLNVVLEKYALSLAIRRGRNKSNEETPTVNN
jgi:hypothetical protein